MKLVASYFNADITCMDNMSLFTIPLQEVIKQRLFDIYRG